MHDFNKCIKSIYILIEHETSNDQVSSVDGIHNEETNINEVNMENNYDELNIIYKHQIKD